MTSLQHLNQHNVAAAPARGGATSILDQEIQRCLSTISSAPPNEQVQRAQSFKNFITTKRNDGELSQDSFALYMGQFHTICAEMSWNRAVAAPRGGIDQATQHAIHMTQVAQYVAGRGASAGGSADGDAAAAAAVPKGHGPQDAAADAAGYLQWAEAGEEAEGLWRPRRCK